MLSIWSLAIHTSRQLRRERLLVGSLAAAVMLAVFALALAPLSLHQDSRIVLDSGLAVASLTGSVLAVCATVRLVGGELTQGHARACLARPIARHTWVAGHALGLCAAIGVVVLMIGATCALVDVCVGDWPPAVFWPALALTVIEATVAVAVTLVFAVWATPMLAGMLAAATLVAGHLGAGVYELMPDDNRAIWWRLLYQVLPDMQLLSLRDEVANRQSVDCTVWALRGGYGLSFAGVCLLSAMLIFTRRRSV